MNLPLVRLTLTHLSLTTVLRDLFSTNETVRNDYQFDKFKSAVLYSRHNFKCLEKKKLDGAIYIKFLDLIAEDFNDDSTIEYPIKISLQYLGFPRLVLEATHMTGSCLYYIYIRNS